ncbi:MAG TPA: hypothetical protein DDW78_01990 [Treponema sp.]|nr:hypothetical protein [Treponema sp.]
MPFDIGKADGAASFSSGSAFFVCAFPSVPGRGEKMKLIVPNHLTKCGYGNIMKQWIPVPRAFFCKGETLLG